MIRDHLSGTSPEEEGDYRKHAPHACPLSRKTIAYDAISTENYQNSVDADKISRRSPNA